MGKPLSMPDGCKDCDNVGILLTWAVGNELGDDVGTTDGLKLG